MRQQNQLHVGKNERKHKKLNYNITTILFIYVNIQSKCSGKWSFQDNLMLIHDNDIILRYNLALNISVCQEPKPLMVIIYI